ncbi:hypothetical protein ACRE_084820 [Hapsidospora chrysogenum ATCC 11550]|uniref:Uncharacterized protein n=1 Tax=Hapsidospora chrysogenum (strain ATCC 11550 / CBS 779.69 / DSM 880 / IAM 14645 / JCM 23072 / IMI 49137) TaxID=857340 RepID=A0A086SUP0_HAPC1|nr:hypothetical protein ACRE_084820 [Hapsidospora chrysogenum ATCC 11550]
MGRNMKPDPFAHPPTPDTVVWRRISKLHIVLTMQNIKSARVPASDDCHCSSVRRMGGTAEDRHVEPPGLAPSRGNKEPKGVFTLGRLSKRVSRSGPVYQATCSGSPSLCLRSTGTAMTCQGRRSDYSAKQAGRNDLILKHRLSFFC